MHKIQRFYLIIAFTVLYTFIIAVLDAQGVESFILQLFIFGFFTLIILGMSVMMAFRFSPKYVELGRKHTEELMNMVPFYLILAMVSVFAYNLDSFTGSVDSIVYIVGGLMTLYLLINYFVSYVVLSETGIKGRSLYTFKTVNLPYSEINQVKLMKGRNCLLVAKNDELLYIELTIVDIKLILNELSRNLQDEIVKEAFTDLKEYYITFGAKDNINEMDYFNKKTETGELDA